MFLLDNLISIFAYPLARVGFAICHFESDDQPHLGPGAVSRCVSV